MITTYSTPSGSASRQVCLISDRVLAPSWLFPPLKIQKKMPVVQPPSFEALGLVSFQISPHYLDPDPATTHMGETQEERIMQFLEENEAPVVGLREGSILLVRDGGVVLKGPTSARIFRRGQNAVEVPSGSIFP